MSGVGCSTVDLDPKAEGASHGTTKSRNASRALSWNAASAIFLFTARAIAVVAQLKYVDLHFGGSFSGLTVVSNQVLLYVMLLELGLAQATISFLYDPILKRDHEKVSALLLAVRSDVRKLILAGSLVIFPVLALYARFLHSQVPYTVTVATLFLVATGAFIQLAAVHYQAYLNAAERLGWVNLIFGAGYLAKTAVGLALALHFHQYLWLPAASSCLSVVELLCLSRAFARVFPKFRKTDWQWAAKTIRHRARFALIHKVAGLAYFQSDFIILSFTVGLIAVKDYAKYQYISAALLSMIGSVAIALTSSFAFTQLSHRPEARFGQYARLQFGAAILGAIAMLGYCFIAPDVVRWAFGRAEPIDSWALGLFGLVLFLNIVKIADDMMITSRGAFRIGYGIPIAEIPIYIGLGVLLTMRIGFAGILIASLVTNLLISILVKGVLLARDVFDSSRRQWFLQKASNVGLALLLASPLVALHFFVNWAFATPVLRVTAWCACTVLYGALILRSALSRFARSVALVATPETTS